jgi:hypothetical protein
VTQVSKKFQKVKETFFFFVVLGFELRALPLESLHQSFSVKGFFEIWSLYLPGLALNRDPPDHCLLSS